MSNFRKLIAIMVAFILIISMTACNVQMVDTTWSYERAIIFMPDGGKIEGRVSSWLDFEGSDMIQVKIDGKTYLTHSSNVILISD
jgi:uncharacterized lipoprotein YehR (DUF1307 family)